MYLERKTFGSTKQYMLPETFQNKLRYEFYLRFLHYFKNYVNSKTSLKIIIM